jgi:hypothetical protein
MFSRTKALAASLLMGATVLFTPASPVAAQPNVVVGDSLVNVQIVDVNVLQNVNVADVADVVAAANVCPAIDATVAAQILAAAQLVDSSGGRQEINCDADAENEAVIFQDAGPGS